MVHKYLTEFYVLFNTTQAQIQTLGTLQAMEEYKPESWAFVYKWHKQFANGWKF